MAKCEHPVRKLLTSYLIKETTVGEDRQVAEHLKDCEGCRKRVTLGRALLATIVADGAESLAERALGEIDD